jgi:hypothetical protein
MMISQDAMGYCVFTGRVDCSVDGVGYVYESRPKG